jgi:Zn-finger nucleic acid-binding protein
MCPRSRDKEDEYFARQEFDRRKALAEKKQAALAAEEQARRKELYWMKCPKCGISLIEVEYKKIKVEKCSHCQGVWFDAGELDAASNLEKSGLNKFFGVFK